MYSVARNTARQAISLLTQEGVLTARRGQGTFVNAPQLSSAQFGLADLSRELQDPDTRVRILEARATQANGQVAQRLELKEGARVISIKRLLARGDDTIFYHSEYLIWDPKRPLVESELGVTSLRGLFSGVGRTDIKRGELTLQAAALKAHEAQYLGTSEGALAWIVSHTFFDFDDRPVSWGRFVCCHDRLKFTANVGTRSEVLQEVGGR